jgi:hypothetical protein
MASYKKPFKDHQFPGGVLRAARAIRGPHALWRRPAYLDVSNPALRENRNMHMSPKLVN